MKKFRNLITFLLFFFTATTVKELEVVVQSSNYPESTSNNSYNYWNFQAPVGFFLSVLFHEMVIEPHWNEFTYFCFGENFATFSKSVDFCSPWSCLTKENSESQPIFKKFASRTSSLKFVFSTLSSGLRFAMKIRAMKMYGKNFHNIHIFNYSKIAKP